MTRPHAVLIPYPGSGHINPTLDLAKLLHANGFFITFVLTESSHRLSGGGSDDTDFRFELIPGGESPPGCRSQQRVINACLTTCNNCAEQLREILVRLGAGDGRESSAGAGEPPPVSCVIINGLMSFALDVAGELGIVAYVFWTTSACGFMGYLHLEELLRRGYAPLKDWSFLTNGYLDTRVDWIPGMKDIRLRDLPSFIRTTDAGDFFLKFNAGEAQKSLKARGLILNTFDDLEHDVLQAMKPMFPELYSLGPLSLLLGTAASERQRRTSLSLNLSLRREDSGCLKWLDKQRKSSVVYVNFGSIAVVSAEQFVQFAWGLAESKIPFLWIVREDLIESGEAALPEGFAEETRGRGFMASWCAQVMELFE